MNMFQKCVTFCAHGVVARTLGAMDHFKFGGVAVSNAGLRGM